MTTNRGRREVENCSLGFLTFADPRENLHSQNGLWRKVASSLLDENVTSVPLIGKISDFVRESSRFAGKKRVVIIRRANRDGLSIFDRAAATVSLIGT